MSTRSPWTQGMASCLFLLAILTSIWSTLAPLVYALWLLLQTSICQEDLTRADKLLVPFCKQFSSLYGNSVFDVHYYTLYHLNCQANVHQLLHWQCKSPWSLVGTQYYSIWKHKRKVLESLPWQSHSWCAGGSFTSNTYNCMRQSYADFKSCCRNAEDYVRMQRRS